MTKKSKKPAEFEIDVKRFYVPGLEATCPTCGETCDHDHLSYPTANKPTKLTFYCGACEDAGREPYEFDRTVTLHVRLEVAL